MSFISYSGDYTKPNNSLPNLLKGTTNISDFLYLMEKLKENEGKETPSPGQIYNDKLRALLKDKE